MNGFRLSVLTRIIALTFIVGALPFVNNASAREGDNGERKWLDDPHEHVGLTYGASWNNRMYKDYSKGYRDVMDDDPDTRSYMDFFPPTVEESSLDKAWLQKVMKNKRDYYRRYREICIIAMVGVYFINIVDAYVDASLAHFDISPDLTLDVTPAAIDGSAIGSRMPSLGLQCAISF